MTNGRGQRVTQVWVDETGSYRAGPQPTTRPGVQSFDSGRQPVTITSVQLWSQAIGGHALPMLRLAVNASAAHRALVTLARLLEQLDQVEQRLTGRRIRQQYRQRQLARRRRHRRRSR